MSGQATSSSQEISSLKSLVEWISCGSTPREDLVIGSEHEKLVFQKQFLNAAQFDGPNGLEEYLQKFTRYNWTPVLENGRTIEMKRGTATLSLEPSGQLEHSTLVHKNLHDMAAEIDEQINASVELAAEMDMQLVGLGYHPLETLNTLPRIPKTRYQNFDGFMRAVDKKNNKGLHVLYSTASAQANIGFENEEDMVKKLRVTIALQPIVTALFANSPFEKGRLAGAKSIRSKVVHNAAGGRYGYMLPVAFEDGFGFERFAEYALNEMPMLGLYQKGQFVDVHGARFADMMAGHVPEAEGRNATLNDWEDHLNCIWPEVRVRRFLEMRGADSGPQEMIKALPALWGGIAYDSGALDQAWQLVRDWSTEERNYLRENTPVYGLQTRFRGKTVQDIAIEVLQIAEHGLKERSLYNDHDQDETCLLEPLMEIAHSGRTWADRLISCYRNEWGGNIKQVFNTMSYANRPSVLKPLPPVSNSRAMRP